MLLYNTAPHAGLANGSRGIVIDIVLDPREPLEKSHANNVQLSYLPTAILFHPFQCELSIPGLPHGVLPLFPTRQSFNLGGKKGVTINRQQFALIPAYAFTDIIDIAKPPSGALTGFNAYVALSRSRGRDTIRLLRDFDQRIFTVHPNEQLREEDQRLAALEKNTLERYRSGEFGKFVTNT
ncbi:hypothetical protein EDB85DRAFT_1892456 [Lactarius pseudohatsudake]|nr:hypothetical protein EDB85DRAFT_1892456 [Lactarius pseudohatsudake]